MSPQGFCAVCGRTFLVGETVRSYVSAEGGHEVCELCAERTKALGWLPADQDGAEERLRADARRRPSFLTKLFARPEREESAEDEHFIRGEALDENDDPEEDRRPVASHDLDTERYDVEAEWSGDEPAVDPGEPAEPTREPVRSTSNRPNALRRLADLLAPASPDSATQADESPSRNVPIDPPSAAAPKRVPLDPPSAPAPKRNAPPDPASHPSADSSSTHASAANTPADPSGDPTLRDAPERESVDPRTNLHAFRERGGPPTPAPAKLSQREPQPSESPRDLPDPAGRGMRPRRLQPDLSPTSRFERAIVRFNAGETGRTVAGLTRTLGAPSVSVGDLAGDEEVVRVTVAWELTWYQWGVDLGDELRPVFELAKGFEVDEIDSAARQWNASAHDGRIVMVAPARRAAESGRPVHR